MFSRLDPDDSGRPLFQQLADHIVLLIDNGQLRAGQRLPAQRQIARDACVNLSTVTRAFGILQKGGYVQTRVGRGSFIAESLSAASVSDALDEPTDAVNLTMNCAPTQAWHQFVAQLLPSMSTDERFMQIADYAPAEGVDWARKAMAQRLSPMLGLHHPERMILTNGAQHGLFGALSTIARPGDVVLTDAVGYMGIAGLCASLGLDLQPIAMDHRGMCPEALDRHCQRVRPAAVFFNPTLHNPLTLTLDAQRRSALAEVVRRHEALIIEDDVYRPLLPDAPRALVSDHDDITIYVTSLSKCVAPGARFGAVLAPEPLVASIASALRVNCWSTSSLVALIVTRLIETGQLSRLIAEQRGELLRRHAVLDKVFLPRELDGAPGAPHAWLKLPAPWRGEDFVRAAAQAGISLLPSAAFAVSRESLPVEAVRISLSAARSVEQLHRAALILRQLMNTRPEFVNPLA